jgi:16S rRNA C967 or C1407 C5-methylase (RsmB/RsmF family)
VTDLPEEFKRQMHAQLGDDMGAFLDALRETAPTSIRFNPAKCKPRGDDPIPWCAAGMYLGSRPSFTRDPLFHAGAYYVQEASSMLLEQAVRQSLDTTKQVIALDLCAAPGGKTTHLLSLLSPESLVVSNEVIRGRASALIENIEKWGYPNTLVTQNDPADFARLEAFFDLIVVDAPCSGEGLFRKDTEAIAEWSTRHVELCMSRQRRILSDIWGSLRPGGLLVYSTCTYNTRENHDNLRWIMDSNACSFLRLRLDPAWGITEVTIDGCSGYQCFPHRVRGEGFFLSAIRKESEDAVRSVRAKDCLVYPTSAEAKMLKTWITIPDETFFFLHGTQARMLRACHQTYLQVILEKLHVLRAGTGVGEVKKNKIVPNHALALSIYRNPDPLPGLAVSVEQALAYLRMEPLRLDTLAQGFRVIEFEGLGLGWVNVLPGRINSLFPSSKRVRLGD